ncbi:monocarboxylate transporter 12-B-like [Myxocyprinus asiaticus]|uniref:monocarboxylate transporter 12-B-like n=1 Tax=Myxocyprinus asiaticus TaxID=70543 RepID=UPI002221641B|nr:monocarboxylate transporter 12-B-like [Myxocyprinus asiaticus]XP_051523370.1 monocarboxylate transporter 12-B-like [Myxocyprinus asiaticus]
MAQEKKKGGVLPPDGGWGWMIVAGCFVVTVCTRAVTRCISIFFIEFQMNFARDYSGTAWIHSLVDCTTMLCAPLGSLIGNRLSCRIAVILGGFLASIGLVLSSFATSLEYLYLSLGVLTGIGFALCYTPAITMVGVYFCERKALAYGIAMSGSGIGTFILAPVVQLLIEHYSWRGALLILGGFVSNLCVCGALLRPIILKEEEACPLPVDSECGYEVKLPVVSGIHTGKTASDKLKVDTKQRCLQSMQEYRFLLMPDFLVLACSFLLLASGCSLPFVYLVPYALDVGVSHHHAAFLMSILGVIDIIGNITFGWLTDRRCLKKYRNICYMFAVGMEGLCCLFIPLLHTFVLLVPFSVLYGYFDGAYVALIPVVTSDVVGTTYLSSALGIVYFLHAVPYLVSPPIGGWLVDTTGTYTATFLLSSFAMISSSLLLFSVAIIRHCQRKHKNSLNKDPKLEPCEGKQVDYYTPKK